MDYAHESHKLSLRQACILFSICFSVYTYKPKPKEDSELRDALAELAAIHTRWGIWMMHHRLRNLGHTWNHKRVYRVYKEMGLNLRRKTKKRLPSRIAEPLLQPIVANETWSMDFMHDVLGNGVKFRSFNVIDDYNREGLNITLDTSLNAKRVVKELDQLIAWRGTPRRIRVDNGPEYISETMRLWAIERKIELKFAEPGSPYQNGYVERFNKSYREEVLDAFTFRKLGEATALTKAWLWMYNNERPHESLGYKSPVDFAQERLRSKAPQTLLCDSNFNWKSLVLNASN